MLESVGEVLLSTSSCTPNSTLAPPPHTHTRFETVWYAMTNFVFPTAHYTLRVQNKPRVLKGQGPSTLVCRQLHYEMMLCKVSKC